MRGGVLVVDPKDGSPVKQTILVVDDEVDILDSMKDLLESSLDDVEVLTAATGIEGLKILGRESVSLIVSDYKMPGMNGLEFLQEARRIAPNAPRVLVTAFPDLQIAIKAINDAGIENFFTKPFDPGQVVDVAKKLLEDRRADEMRSKSFARSLDTLRRRLEPGSRD